MADPGAVEAKGCHRLSGRPCGDWCVHGPLEYKSIGSEGRTLQERHCLRARKPAFP